MQIVFTLWFISALFNVGRKQDALDLFENVLAKHVNHVGLVSECVDVCSGENWGNIPHTLAQIGLIRCAIQLSDAWDFEL